MGHPSAVPRLAPQACGGDGPCRAGPPRATVCTRPDEQGTTMATSLTKERRPPRQDLLRPPARPGHPVHDRDVGALQLLRHAGAAHALPAVRRPGRVKGLQRRPGHDLATATAIYSIYTRDGLPARHAGRLARRPGLGARARRSRSRPATIMVGHLTLALPGRGHVLRRPGAGGARLRACSRPTSRRWSATSTRARTTRAGTAASRSSTWASTSVPSSRR